MAETGSRPQTRRPGASAAAALPAQSATTCKVEHAAPGGVANALTSRAAREARGRARSTAESAAASAAASAVAPPAKNAAALGAAGPAVVPCIGDDFPAESLADSHLPGKPNPRRSGSQEHGRRNRLTLRETLNVRQHNLIRSAGLLQRWLHRLRHLRLRPLRLRPSPQPPATVPRRLAPPRATRRRHRRRRPRSALNHRPQSNH